MDWERSHAFDHEGVAEGAAVGLAGGGDPHLLWAPHDTKRLRHQGHLPKYGSQGETDLSVSAMPFSLSNSWGYNVAYTGFNCSCEALLIFLKKAFCEGFLSQGDLRSPRNMVVLGNKGTPI